MMGIRSESFRKPERTERGLEGRSEPHFCSKAELAKEEKFKNFQLLI